MAQLSDPGPIQFEATLQQSEASGAACWVEFPHDLKKTYGKGNLVPVNVTFDGRVPYRGSLAMMGGDRAMIVVRKDKLVELGKGQGDQVRVKVELDTVPRRVELADDVRAALNASPAAAEHWETLSYSHQREYHEWIEQAKKPETRQRRIARMVERVAAGERLKG